MRGFFVALALAGCALPSGELLTPGGPLAPLWLDCDAALANARVGDACAQFVACRSADAGCCVDLVRCSSGVISTAFRDCSACGACTDDTRCQPGQWCVDGSCQTCPEVTSCRPCLPPQVSLLRNGCRTCDCGPPSTCGSCGANPCTESRYCQMGCSGAGCCVLQCEEARCGPSVVGCAMPCGSMPCRFCIASRCVCDVGRWRCDPVCAESAEPWASRCRAP